jgi:hypothetical protein
MAGEKDYCNKLQLQSLARRVIARGEGPEAISQSLVSVILPFDFYLVLLSSNMVTGSSLRTVLLPLKRDLKLAEKKESAS